MRTSVGPLPAAVYWRRRAVVLGAVLVGVLVLFLSCGGDGDKADPRGTGSGTTLPSPGARTSATPDVVPSFEDALPGGPVLPDPSDVVATTAPPAVGTSTNSDVNVAAPEGECADAEVSVTPVPVKIAIKRGTALPLRLKIKNIMTRQCSRDVGADLQEIYVKQGAQLVWSSDKCGTAKGSQMTDLTPNEELEYVVTWNGRMSSQCAGGLAVGAVPLAGEYQVFGRLGGKVSDPVRIVVTP
jgi:hypothetical protein